MVSHLSRVHRWFCRRRRCFKFWSQARPWCTQAERDSSWSYLSKPRGRWWRRGYWRVTPHLPEQTGGCQVPSRYGHGSLEWRSHCPPLQLWVLRLSERESYEALGCYSGLGTLLTFVDSFTFNFLIVIVRVIVIVVSQSSCEIKAQSHAMLGGNQVGLAHSWVARQLRSDGDLWHQSSLAGQPVSNRRAQLCH